MNHTVSAGGTRCGTLLRMRTSDVSPVAGSHSADFDTAKPNQRVAIYFRTDSFNINFEFRGKLANGDTVTMRESARVDSHVDIFTVRTPW